LGQQPQPPECWWGASLTTAEKLENCFSIGLPQSGQAGDVPGPDLTRTSSILPQDKHLYSNMGIVVSLLSGIHVTG
jgi:hypothetical protein